ncbi:MAG: hypothetical protein HY286_08935 [Planctomycetes bacterium]|nr:hypothetical protein [Planctomycetota bacterium]
MSPISVPPPPTPNHYYEIREDLRITRTTKNESGSTTRRIDFQIIDDELRFEIEAGLRDEASQRLVPDEEVVRKKP